MLIVHVLLLGCKERNCRIYIILNVVSKFTRFESVWL